MRAFFIYIKLPGVRLMLDHQMEWWTGVRFPITATAAVHGSDSSSKRFFIQVSSLLGMYNKGHAVKIHLCRTRWYYR